MYSQALLLHVVALVMCISLGAVFLLFIMRPCVHRVTAEARRVAELLSEVPAELDVEGMVAEALRSDAKENPQADLEAKNAGALAPAEALKAKGAGSSRRGSLDLSGSGGIVGPPPRRGSLDDPAASSAIRFSKVLNQQALKTMLGF